MKDDYKKYSVNFDLSTAELREHYSAEHPEGAYSKIREFLEKRGYIHVQGSGYHTSEAVSLQSNYDTLNEMKEKFAWLKYSVKSMYLTEIGESYDATYLYRDDVNVEYRKLEEIEKSRDRIKIKWEIDHSDDEYEY